MESGGALGMLAIGAGGLDVAFAAAGEPYHLRMPRAMGVHLKGKLRPWISEKDIILELLTQFDVHGGTVTFLNTLEAVLTIFQSGTGW